MEIQDDRMEKQLLETLESDEAENLSFEEIDVKEQILVSADEPYNDVVDVFLTFINALKPEYLKWKKTKFELFISKVKVCKHNKNLKMLYIHLEAFSKELREDESVFTDEAQNWKIDFFLKLLAARYIIDGLELCSKTIFLMIMEIFEECLKETTFRDDWKTKDRQQWLQTCYDIKNVVLVTDAYSICLAHLEEIFGINIEDLKDMMDELDDELQICSEKLKKDIDIANIFKVSGAVCSVVGGVLGIVGVALEAVTFGASTGLIIAGIALTSSGAGTTITSEIVKKIFKKKVYKECHEHSIRVQKQISMVAYILQQFYIHLEDIEEFLKTEKGQEFKKVLEIIREGGDLGKNVLSIGLNTYNAARIGLLIEEVGSAGATGSGISAAGSGLGAGAASASGVGKILASVLSKSLRIFGNALCIAFGLFDIVTGSIDIHNGEKLPKEIQSYGKCLQESIEEIENFYKSQLFNPIFNKESP